MSHPFSIALLIWLVLLTLFVALPIKIGAHLVHAQYTGIIRCGVTAIVAFWGGALAALLVGGLIGGALAWLIGYLLLIRLMLGTTFLGAIGLTIIATLVSWAGLWFLMWLGLLWPMPVAAPMFSA